MARSCWQNSMKWINTGQTLLTWTLLAPVKSKNSSMLLPPDTHTHTHTCTSIHCCICAENTTLMSCTLNFRMEYARDLVVDISTDSYACFYGRITTRSVQLGIHPAEHFGHSLFLRWWIMLSMWMMAWLISKNFILWKLGTLLHGQVGRSSMADVTTCTVTNPEVCHDGYDA